ncbi:MAG TPA: preprotein translocase subunit YajC [Nocardioidaceae bacterium]|nr:preprotein translocase subunit YajC [Nocardioidaceae bacterium]
MSPDQLAGILPLVLIVLAFWFLVIRPARKRQHEMTRIQNSVDVGAEVMLGSGIYGTVTAVADDTLQLQVAPGTTMKVARQAVVRVVAPVAPRTDPTGDESSSRVVDEQD